MKFAAFQNFRESLLRERRDVLDCAETNLYRTLARLAPPPTPAPAQQVHRCHLAGEWCARFGFPPENSARALISSGVRDSLARLFAHCAANKALVWLPSDNYPVYGELARAARCEINRFSTLETPQWPKASPVARPEILLVTNPMKPLGRYLSDADVSILRHWLAASPQRRLWLDTVYTFDTRFDSPTLALLQTGRTILLHSLTKGWLQPRLFGIALVPEQDAASLTPAFRENPPPQTNLARARECLGMYATTPAVVAEALGDALAAMTASMNLSEILARSVITQGNAPGYFVSVRAPWRDLLEDQNILGIPATAFGSAREDLTILSTLSFAR